MKFVFPTLHFETKAAAWGLSEVHLKENYFQIWFKVKRKSLGIYSGSKVLLCLFQPGGNTFPSAGNLYFSYEGSASTLPLQQMHLPWQVYSIHSHTSELSKTSTAAHWASLLQQLGYLCFAQGQTDTDSIRMCTSSSLLVFLRYVWLKHSSTTWIFLQSFQ